jgi:hypothetical protein
MCGRITLPHPAENRLPVSAVGCDQHSAATLIIPFLSSILGFLMR